MARRDTLSKPAAFGWASAHATAAPRASVPARRCPISVEECQKSKAAGSLRRFLSELMR